MKKKNCSTLDLHYELQKCLFDNKPRYSTNQALNDASLSFDSQIDLEYQLTKELNSFASNNPTGVKGDARIAMAIHSDAMRRRVQSAYLAPEDREKFTAANITYSDVAYGHYLNCTTIARNVYDMADALTAAQKTKAGVTVGNLKDLDDAINLCVKMSTSNRSKIVLRRNTDKNLHDALRKTSKFVHDTLDSLVGAYRTSDPSFYNEWLMAREFVNPASSRAQITGTVTASDGTPLRNVKVTASNGVKVFEDMTDKQGNYKIPVSPELYNITFALPSYNTGRAADVFVDAGEKEVVNTSLVHLNN